MPLLYTSVHIKPSHRMVEISRSSFRRYKANDTCFSWTMASSHISIADGSERRLLRGPFFGMLLSTILLGTVGAQMWFYLHQNQDGRLLRVTVAVLL
ncbi:hypothetical protein C8R41DRAFT_839657 [Lentinula lateritia]|uniref:Uncharacterized protein n=1 Tax=Lentinula lateritia TaxID=40482 RepID=A0ABQ8VE88_9AGAR|nr:hypothetical protein C8R41DRAFT_839657 [Lentinula lateritia]